MAALELELGRELEAQAGAAEDCAAVLQPELQLRAASGREFFSLSILIDSPHVRVEVAQRELVAVFAGRSVLAGQLLKRHSPHEPRRDELHAAQPSTAPRPSRDCGNSAAGEGGDARLVAVVDETGGRHVVDERRVTRRFAIAFSIFTSCTPAADSGKPVAPARPQLIAASAGRTDVAGLCAEELEKAHAQHAQLVVYVGAPWCEPCRRFHDALSAGQLDAAFPDVRFLEFNHDQSKDELTKAGYVSTLIPLFAIPNRDGTASQSRMEGSIKGDSAVAQNLVPRLKSLLAGAPPR